MQTIFVPYVRRTVASVGGVLSALLIGMALLLTSSAQLQADEGVTVSAKPKIFVHPHVLTPSDTLLTDGKNGKPVPIRSDSVLVWVDFHPNARFAHATEYLLVSKKGTQVIKGSWWPILNGQDLFRDGPAVFPVLSQ